MDLSHASLEWVLHSVATPMAMGVVLVGAATQRTLTVIKGNITQTAALSVVMSSVYWANIKYVADQQITEYVSFAIGTILVTSYIAYVEKQKRGKEKCRSTENQSNSKN